MSAQRKVLKRQASARLIDSESLTGTATTLAAYALGIYPVAFGQITQMITGRSPDDPGFQADWAAFLDELGRRLARK